MNFSTNNPYWCQLIEEHRLWLSQYDPQHLKNWETLFSNNDESAMCEAGVRRLLQLQKVTVCPNEDTNQSGKSPDFKCSKDDRVFYVEVTCISIKQVTKETNIPSFPEPGADFYSTLKNSIWSVCKGKAVQCSGMSHPTILAIGTFHYWASSVCVTKTHVEELLTGEINIAWKINKTTAEISGDYFQSTKLHSAVFLRPDEMNEIGFARSSISGLLICGLGVEPPNMLGVLHPNPSRPFDKDILSDVKFCKVSLDREGCLLSVNWERKR